MLIREAAYPDIDDIFALHEQSRAAFRRALISQWTDGRPDYDDIFGDIDDGICYTVTDGGTAGTFVCDFSDDTCYHVAPGCDWHPGEYAVLHRISVDEKADPVEVIKAIVDFVANRCSENGVRSIRSGAHPKDETLIRALEGCGFEPCGRLRTAAGEERTAYRLWVGEE